MDERYVPPEKGTDSYYDQLSLGADSTQTYRERRWNRYYRSCRIRVLKTFLSNEIVSGPILDLGCGDGRWLHIWKRLGFKEIHGVDFYHKRVKEAKQAGYDVVYNCDASEIPVSSDSYHFVCSNSMFIHVLQLEHQAKIIVEVERILKPGGVFFFNFTPPRSVGTTQDFTDHYQGFYALDTVLRRVVMSSGLVLEDVQPSFFPTYSLVRKALGGLIVAPSGISLLHLHDKLFAYRVQLQKSRAIYLKLRKAK